MTSTQALTSPSNSLKKATKWLFLASTSAYILYKLSTYSDYGSLLNSFSLFSSQQILYFAIVVLLLPLNLFLETYKWRFLVSKTMPLSYTQALKAVLAGFSTGFTTPNRLGEMAGRMLFVKPEHRKISAFYTLLNGFTQNLIIVAIGLPATIYFWNTYQNINTFQPQSYILLTALLFCLSVLLYFTLPTLASSKFISSKLAFLSDIQQLSTIDLLQICTITFIRYLVFSIQMYGMLLFFNLNITFSQALISIPASYLSITLIPTFALSEASVRGSVGLFFIGHFCNYSPAIVLASLVLWLLNFGTPMLIGLKVIADIK